MAQWTSLAEDRVQLPDQVVQLLATPDPADPTPLASHPALTCTHPCLHTHILKIKSFYFLRKTNNTHGCGAGSAKERKKRKGARKLMVWSIASCPRSRHLQSEGTDPSSRLQNSKPRLNLSPL